MANLKPRAAPDPRQAVRETSSSAWSGPALSLHIGLNEVDPARYENWNEPLDGCLNDARAMQRLSNKTGLKTRVLLGRDATREAVLGALAAAQLELAAGGFFMITYSGHGGRAPNFWKTCFNETWCLFDGQLVDEELFERWTQFAPGSRILIVSDSCHSGGMYMKAGTPLEAEASPDEWKGKRKQLPEVHANKVVRAHADHYRGIHKRQVDRGWRGKDAVGAAGLKGRLRLLSACDADEITRDGHPHGVFTRSLLAAWGDGDAVQSYDDLHAAISRQLKLQRPQHVVKGAANRAYDKARPFTA